MLKMNVSQSTRDFNFRTLKKLTAFILYDQNKAEELERPNDYSGVVTLEELEDNIKDAYQLLIEEDGNLKINYPMQSKEIEVAI